MLLRSRLSFLSADVHTSQSQAIMGTPLLVPVPRKVMVNGGQITFVKIGNKKGVSKVSKA